MSSKDLKQVWVLWVTGRQVSLVAQVLVCPGWRAHQREGSATGPGGHVWPPSGRRGYGLQGSGSALALPPRPRAVCLWGSSLCPVEGLGGDSEHLREAWGSLELGWVPLSDCEQ